MEATSSSTDPSISASSSNIPQVNHRVRQFGLGAHPTALIVALSVFVIALSLLRPTTSKPSTKPAALLTGTPNGVLLGVKLEAEDSQDVGRQGQVLAVSKTPRVRITLSGNLLPATTSELSSSKVGIDVSALLDFRQPLKLDGRTKRTAVIESGERRQWEWELDPVTLAEGRHCVLVTAIEDGNAVINKQLPSHSGAGFYELQVGTGPDYCKGQARSPLPVDGSLFQVYAGCSFPVLSPKPDSISVRRSMRRGEDLWLITPRCQKEVKIAIILDGTVQGVEDQVPSISAPVDPQTGGWVFPLPRLDTGVWTCVAVQRSPLQSQELANIGVCPPVLIA